MRSLFIFVIFFYSSILFANEDLLKKVDSYRSPSDSYTMNVLVKSTTEEEDAKFLVYIKGNSKTLIKILAPKKNLKKNMLMLDENMWVYIPNIRRAVRVSLNQKLTGETANGDISRMRWSGDYTYKVESENDKETILFLTAAKKNLTYSKIRVWIKTSDKSPIKADFLTLSGKVIKTAKYEDYQEVLGQKRSMQIRITDHLQKDKESLIIISDLKNVNLPDSLFQEKSLE